MNCRKQNFVEGDILAVYFLSTNPKTEISYRKTPVLLANRLFYYCSGIIRRLA